MQLDPDPKVELVSACNNAAWSVSEVALRYGTGMSPHSYSTALEHFRPKHPYQMIRNTPSGSGHSSPDLSQSSYTRGHHVASTKMRLFPLV